LATETAPIEICGTEIVGFHALGRPVGEAGLKIQTISSRRLTGIEDEIYRLMGARRAIIVNVRIRYWT